MSRLIDDVPINSPEGADKFVEHFSMYAELVYRLAKDSPFTPKFGYPYMVQMIAKEVIPSRYDWIVHEAIGDCHLMLVGIKDVPLYDMISPAHEAEHLQETRDGYFIWIRKEENPAWKAKQEETR